MSLERLYFNDPFSNIVISCDIRGLTDKTIITSALKKTIVSFDLLEKAVLLDDKSNLKYTSIGHACNLENISFTDKDDLTVIKSLMSHPFALQNGETLKTVIRSNESGYTVYFCMHHIIGDAMSLILLLKRFLAILQNMDDININEYIPSAPETYKELNGQSKYLVSSINKHYPHKRYSESDYLSLFEHIYGNNDLEINKIIIGKEELDGLKSCCKKLGVSLTSYIVSKIFEVQNIEMLCLPTDLRTDDNCFGNYVGRIDIPLKIISGESNAESRIILIDKHIKKIRGNKALTDDSQELLEQIQPEFYDDVIFDVYSDFSNPFVRRMAGVIGYKSTKPTMYLSNLRSVVLPYSEKLTVGNLCFYPPHPIERVSTIGIVTHNDQMIITIQKFRKEMKHE